MKRRLEEIRENAKRKGALRLGRRLAAGLVASALLVGAALGLAGCGRSDKSVSAQSAYDVSVIGGIGLLENGNNDTAASASRAVLASKAAYSGELDASEREAILNNLAIARATLGGEIIKSEVQESDREGYGYRYSVSAKDITGGETEYVFYYNETGSRTDGELFERETVTAIEGIAVHGSGEYSVRGTVSTEGSEREMEIRVDKGNGDFVVIEQESERGESEFSYTKYEGSREVYETSVGYEKSIFGGVELSFETEIDGEETEYKFSFSSEDGYGLVAVEVEQGRKETVALIRITSGEGGESYEFVYSGEGKDR